MPETEFPVVRLVVFVLPADDQPVGQGGDTVVVGVKWLPGAKRGAEGVMERLRRNDPPVIARIEEDRVLLDPRTVMPEEEDSLLSALQASLFS